MGRNAALTNDIAPPFADIVRSGPTQSSTFDTITTVSSRRPPPLRIQMRTLFQWCAFRARHGCGGVLRVMPLVGPHHAMSL